MKPILRDDLIYAIGVLAGFAVYLVLDRGSGGGFAFALVGGFFTIHGAIVPGRRFL